MARRFGTASARRRKARGRTGVVLAVYHMSAEVEHHIAALKRLRRFKVMCIQQRSVAARGPSRVADVVLWELGPGRRRPSLRRLKALARGALLVSYSADSSRQLADVSRAIGFMAHLKAPLSAFAIERELALADPIDLSERMQALQPTLRRHLARHDVLADLFCHVNASVEPQRVADALTLHACNWLPVPTWAIVVPDEVTFTKLLASRGFPSSFEESALALGGLIIRRGEETMSANLQRDRRTPGGPAVAALGFPLVSRGCTVGALLGFDAQPAERVPTLSGGFVDTLVSLLEPAAVALDNALRLQRTESLSLTDDLTRLYNS